MISRSTLLLLSVSYIAILFAVAHWGDRRAAASPKSHRPVLIYSLALCVYCTSWTFYGAVGRAASAGWDFLPIYLGPACVFLFGYALLQRIIAISKRNNITSVADFLGARYGRHQAVPALVTVIAVFGITPYMALQLKAVSFGFDVLVGSQTGAYAGPYAGHAATFAVAAVMAVFAILFGTRELRATENHHGMVLAVAFESLVKLIAFIAVGCCALALLLEHMGIDSGRLELPGSDAMDMPVHWVGFVTQTVLAATAIICLPRQFHITVVEHAAPGDLRTARLVFPAYLLLISLFVIPIVEAGRLLLQQDIVSPDTYVLAIPMVTGRPWLGLVAYIGGFSAATGMVIVESIAIATMVSNELFMPVFLRSRFSTRRVAIPRVLTFVRRATIVALFALAYLYLVLFSTHVTLRQLGLLSFAAVAQFAPALIGGVLWRGGNHVGVIAGLLAGTGLWAYTLLLPSVARAGSTAGAIVSEGPAALAWLRPTDLLNLQCFPDAMSHGVFWSLSVNVLLYVVCSWLHRPGLRERMQAASFLDERSGAVAPAIDAQVSPTTAGDLQELAHAFLGPQAAQALLQKLLPPGHETLREHDRFPSELARGVEHALAGVIGASSARLVLRTTLRGRNMRPEEVVRLLDDTSHEILFTRELLRTALENLPQGVSVVDKDLKLVAWNQRYAALFEYPAELMTVGRPVEDLIRCNALRGWLLGDDAEEAVARRLRYMLAGREYVHERVMPNGVVLEIRGNPLPGGGFVTSYSDVTIRRNVQEALSQGNTTLERRVHERTAELLALNAQLAQTKNEVEEANLSKTRFLAATSHDLAQPITAARLFIASVNRSQLPAATAGLVARAEDALTSAEETLTSLLDLARLDGGSERCRFEHFDLHLLLQALLSDFAQAAADKGLQVRVLNCHQVVHSDPHLLRRVLQNFVANAIRYTAAGRITIGCRRLGSSVGIHVIDTGPGIADELQIELFQEYRRLDHAVAREGLGLGLAIARRISLLMGQPIALRSIVGRGCDFSITVASGSREHIAGDGVPNTQEAGRNFDGARICCIDDDPDVLSGLQSLLCSWGCSCEGYDSAEAALAAASVAQQPPDVLIVDYHLGGNLTGMVTAARLHALWCKPVPVPVILITAADLRGSVHNEDGGVRVMNKPLKPGALRALLDVLLS